MCQKVLFLDKQMKKHETLRTHYQAKARNVRRI
jgi:hypothetical protein